jgi:hypothetical protein
MEVIRSWHWIQWQWLSVVVIIMAYILAINLVMADDDDPDEVM